MPLYTSQRGWSVGGGPVSAISGTNADQTLLSFTIPGKTLINVGDTVAFSWRGQVLQNIDANQTVTIAAQVVGADVVRRQSPTIINSTAARAVQIKGEIQNVGTTNLMSFLDFQIMSGNQSLAGAEVGLGSLTSPLFSTRTISSVAGGATVNWSSDITFSLLMAMMTASASFSLQGFGWHAEKLSI